MNRRELLKPLGMVLVAWPITGQAQHHRNDAGDRRLAERPAAGVIVDHFGYSAAFLTLGAAAGVALIVFALGMPETAEPETAPLQA